MRYRLTFWKAGVVGIVAALGVMAGSGQAEAGERHGGRDASYDRARATASLDVRRGYDRGAERVIRRPEAGQRAYVYEVDGERRVSIAEPRRVERTVRPAGWYRDRLDRRGDVDRMLAARASSKRDAGDEKKAKQAKDEGGLWVMERRVHPSERVVVVEDVRPTVHVKADARRFGSRADARPERHRDRNDRADWREYEAKRDGKDFGRRDRHERPSRSEGRHERKKKDTRGDVYVGYRDSFGNGRATIELYGGERYYRHELKRSVFTHPRVHVFRHDRDRWHSSGRSGVGWHHRPHIKYGHGWGKHHFHGRHGDHKGFHSGGSLRLHIRF